MKKICENCQEEFETESGKKRFCTDRCRVAFNRAKDKVFTPENYEKLPSFLKQPKWVKEIEDYCGNAGILPSELIEFHRSANKGVVSKEKEGEVIVKDMNKTNVVGKPYDPMKNPRFLGKISPTKE